MSKYKISVVMAVYNVEKYLEEAILSIVKQTIGFEENVQLILVNDGSKDKSEAICLKYKELYSDNICYCKKQNGGLSSAKNYGLNYVQGEYVTYTDSDDYLTETTLQNMYDFLVNNSLNMASLFIEYFERKQGLHPHYLNFKPESTVINLSETPNTYILSSAATFYKYDYIKDLEFNETVVTGEDLLYNSKIFLKDGVFGILSPQEGKYMYRIRNIAGSLIDKTHIDIRWYKNNIETIFGELTANKYVPPFLQHIIVREILFRLRVNNYFTDQLTLKEKTELLKLYGKYLQFVEEKTIIEFKTEYQFKAVLFNLKDKNYTFKAKLNIDKNGPVYYKTLYNRMANVKSHTLKISNIKYTNNKFILNCYLNDYVGENFELELYKNGQLAKTIKKDVLDNPVYWKKSMSEQVFEAYNIRIEIPSNNGNYHIKIATENWKHQIKLLPIPKSAASLNLENMKLFRGKKMLIFNNLGFKIKKSYFKTFIKNEYRIWKEIYAKYKKIPIYRLFGYGKKNIWLFNDRRETAMDNGEAMFKYVNTIKELKGKAYFAVSKDSKDYNRLKKYGKVVKHGSFMHKILYMRAKNIVTSHVHQDYYKPFSDNINILYNDLHNYNLIFLQHGIIINDVSVAVNKQNRNIDLFVTSTEKEQKFIRESRYMYNKKDVILTGLPRYDYLESKPENIITISPTWRSYLSESTGNGNTANFEKTDYFQKYKRVLESKKLKRLLEQQNYTIKFLLHQEMVSYKQIFKKLESNNVKILSPGDETYSKLISETKLFVTDYSSIFFDFSYLLKPTIYFQFDKKEFFGKHYKPGYFDYENDGFGRVVKDDTKLINMIIYYINNKCNIEPVYEKRIKETFKYMDKNNCKRVCDEILKLK